MNYSIIHTLNQFNLEFENSLKTPSCLPVCLEDLCAGWTIDSFQQILSRLTLKNTASVPMFFQKPEEMICFSNKLNTLSEVFKLFDTRGLGRIDTYELISMIIISCSGSQQRKIEILFNVFSISDEGIISKDGFCFLLDVFIRGLSKSLLRSSDSFYPRNPNFRLSNKEIDLIASNLFKREDKISAADFLSYISKDSGSLRTLFTLYPNLFMKSQEFYRDLMTTRLKSLPFLKSILVSLIKSLPVSNH